MTEYKGGLILYQAPVLGYGASPHFEEPGYVDLGLIDDFGSNLGSGFSFIVDFQSDSEMEQYIFGVKTPNKTGLGLHLHSDDIINRLQFDLVDDNGHSLSGYCQLSKAASKRIFIIVDPTKRRIRFYELNLFRSFALKVTYLSQDSLQSFSNFNRSLIVGGCNSEKDPFRWFYGRIGNFGIFKKPIPIEQKDEIFKFARDELLSMLGLKIAHGLERERLEVFVADLARLRELSKQPIFTDQNTGDASLILVKWLFDRHPILLDLCDELGVQITFPGHNEKEVEYMQTVIDFKPIFFQVGTTGPEGMFGFNWVSPSAFGNQVTFSVEDVLVKQADLIRFITDKLGWRHLDLKERNRWQKRLKLISDSISAFGNKAINYQIKVVVDNVIKSINSCGIEDQIRIQTTFLD
jgi:hypothetical protein